MAKFPWKRKDAEATPPSLDSYLSAQPIDYTSIPVDEEEGLATRFQRLPFPVRVALFLVPLLLLVGLGWAGYQFAATPPVQAVAPTAAPAPQLQLSAARVVNPQEIVVMGATQDVPDGTSASARVLQDGEPIDWIDAAENVGIVNGNAIALRVRKSSAWTEALRQDATYTVELTIASSPEVSASQPLDVPEPLAESFFGVAVAPTTEPTPEPTVAPTTPEATAAPEPTVAPEPTTAPAPQIATLTVGANATLLVSPTLGSPVIATAANGASYQPLLRTPDGQFFLVFEGNRVGWLPAGQVTIDSAQAAQVALTTPSKEAVEAGPLRATVFNGGNIRYGPSIATGTVLGQLHAGETVTVKERTGDGVWYHVVAPEAEGWVHVSLLRIDRNVLSQIPNVN